MGGKGHVFLAESLERITRQTYKDFDVVVSDQSADNLIEKTCAEYAQKLDIRYIKEPTGVRASSVNINNAIRNATGELIKILFLDDFLYHDDALKDIVEAFDVKKDSWLVTASIHTHDAVTYYRHFQPRYDDRLILKKNTISSPSVLTIKNKEPLLFDEKLIWWMDLDYYKRCFDAFGLPKILAKTNVVNREGTHQVTHTTANQKRREEEFRYMLKKYRYSFPFVRLIAYKMSVKIPRIKAFVKKIIHYKSS